MAQSETGDRPYHHGELRSALIVAAEAWMRDRGNWAFTLRELARDLGVSHNAPYRHFPDKASLLSALAERGFGRLGARLDRHLDLDPDPITRVRALASGYVGFARDEPAVFRLMFGDDLSGYPDPALHAAAATAFARLSDAIEAGVEAGLLRPDPDGVHPITAWALVHGLAGLAIDGRLRHGLDVDGLVGRVADTLIDGLKRADA